MSGRINISQAAKGKWPSILPQVGVSKDYLTGRHGPCPICQDGKDRFRFDNKDGRGTFYCSVCGSGDGIELVKRVNDWDFKRAAREIEKFVGAAPVIPIRQGRSPEEVRREMNDIWRGGKPLGEVEATSLYWLRRTGSLPQTTELRAVRSLRCPGHGDFPGMVAMVRDLDGKPCNLHRTFLTPAGEKADISEPRRVMDIGLPKGSSVRLAPAAEVMGVAEGIETAESARLLFDVPCWAALNAENLKGFVPPRGVQKLIIFGDNDSSFTGQASAMDLARRLWAKRKDWEPELQIHVRVPGMTIDYAVWDRDWNDYLNIRRAKQGEAA